MPISRRTLDVLCPNCGARNAFSLLSSIDAGRDPRSRTAILDRTLQQQPCAVCGTAVRPPPAFMYFDSRSRLWVSAHAWSNRAAWPEWEERARTNFQTIREAGSSIGKQMQAGAVRARVTFGWEALREKIIATEGGLDDALLEAYKQQRNAAELERRQLPVGESRLLTVAGDHVVLGRIAPDSERIIEETSIPRTVFDQHMQAAAADGMLRQQLQQGLFVDLYRLAIASE